jgi:hypothetical protein
VTKTGGGLGEDAREIGINGSTLGKGESDTTSVNSIIDYVFWDVID